MVRPANRIKKTKKITIKLPIESICKTDPVIEQNEGNARRQFPKYQNQSSLRSKKDQPAARPVKKIKIKTLKRSKTRVRTPIGRIPQAKRRKTGFSYGYLKKYYLIVI